MATEDEIFEYVPPSAAAPEDATPPQTTEGLDTAPLVSSEEAFRAAAAGLARDAAGRALHGGRAPQRSAFEHPRLKLARLRREPFALSTETRLASHPYVLAAEDCSLTLAQRRAFAGEQHAVQLSDARSFARTWAHFGGQD